MKNVILSLVLLVGCGDKGFQFTAGQLEKDNKQAEVSAVASLKGSAQYAFELTVDDQEFADIEDYYTQQVDVLKDKVIEAGYDVDRIEFTGKLGFADFIKDMSVFVASSANTQGKGAVDAQGNFSVSVPNPNKLESMTFKVRAQKRVQILLIKDEVLVQKLCYNFSAIEMDVIENPISLSNFKTDRTMYDCSKESGGMAIPSASAAPLPASFTTLNLNDTVDAMWVNGNQFLVDVNGQRQAYVINGLIISTVGSSQAPSEDPVGFTKVVRTANITEMHSVVSVGNGDTLSIKDRINYSEVSVLRNGIANRAFLVSGFGLNLFANEGSKVFAVGRVAGTNSWKVGQLDLINDKFVARADALNGLWGNAATAMMNGLFVMVGGDQILFVAM
jgi:hypothetical protein